MNENTVTGDIIALKLRQLDTKDIRMIRSNMYFVDFELEDGTRVSTCLTSPKATSIFCSACALMRLYMASSARQMRLWSLSARTSPCSAMRSRVPIFLRLSRPLRPAARYRAQIERLFLTHNTNPQKLEEIYDVLQVIIARITELNETSERIEIE